MQRQGLGGSAVIRFRATGVLLLVAHLAFVGWLTLRPLDVPWVTAANLQPFAGIKADLALGPAQAARRIGEALLLLAPLGVLLPMAGGRLQASSLGSFLRTVAAGAMLSLGIELLQTAVPGQVVDIDSLLLNTVGVAVAHLALVPAARARIRRRQGLPGRLTLPRDEASQGPTPTIPRVGIAP
ncbi:VanZ family protein [Streptomyces sp. YC504]|uniref:VanZ family protein n=1 Tax=Streptomyces mesophilus TaxID=1775132 RepID=A0A6G4XJI2_9ACTN|nr:VanZ family protein [Streptomyces mesophilus]NGO77342.1 VanZ family protein [Streptomyces mesophilus]